MTLLKNPSISEKPVRAFLQDLCRQPALHGRFLNTLSLMELIGSRKILLSRQGPTMSEDVLRHYAEEARHAYFFRAAAERAAARSLEYGRADTLAPASARMYMERLDAAVARELRASPELAYPYVTLAVELRAAWLYGLYESVLRSREDSLTLKSVLAEEDLHLRETGDSLRESDPLYEPRRGVFTALEAGLFERWLAAIRRAAFPGREQSEFLL